jgi:exopolyphosphatase/guanosine-5'-triphosphate,3'-diphosphate pyrophosphatase
MTPDGEWDAVAAFIDTLDGQPSLLAVGTGGNINRYHRLSRADRAEPVTLKAIKKLHSEMSAMTYDERVDDLGLKPDRADVILPAGEIYMKIMALAKCKGIIVPKVGLSDGIILDLFRSITS